MNRLNSLSNKSGAKHCKLGGLLQILVETLSRKIVQIFFVPIKFSFFSQPENAMERTKFFPESS
jgi:hypothetical protein